MSDLVSDLAAAGRVVLDALSSAGDPFGVSTILSILRAVWSQVETCKNNRSQLAILTHLACSATQTLVRASRARAVDEKEAGGFRKVVLRVQAFVAKQASAHLLASLLRAKETQQQILRLHTQLTDQIALFGMAAAVDAVEHRNKLARAQHADAKALEDLLKTMSTSIDALHENLDLAHQSEMAVMQSLLVNIKSVGADNARMKDALSTILACLQRQSGRRAPPLQTYTITSFDIDFGARVGRGGFSEVFRGKWRGSEIAVKVLDRRVSERMILREVKVWNELRHPHVVQMFGASVYEDPPFIVMPLMRYGDVLAYLQDHNPNADRRSLAAQIARGLDHLHSRDIVHGDLKALNVLIDDAGVAKLADFGLTRIKATLTTAATAGKAVLGSLRWMAPERLTGGQLDQPVDVYALGITFWELFTGEVPLSGVDDAWLVQVVVDRGRRPARPRKPIKGLDDKFWRLIEDCWAAAPEARPTTRLPMDLPTSLHRGPPEGLVEAKPDALPLAGGPSTPNRSSNALFRRDSLASSSSSSVATFDGRTAGGGRDIRVKMDHGAREMLGYPSAPTQRTLDTPVGEYDGAPLGVDLARSWDPSTTTSDMFMLDDAAGGQNRGNARRMGSRSRPLTTDDEFKELAKTFGEQKPAPGVPDDVDSLAGAVHARRDGNARRKLDTPVGEYDGTPLGVGLGRLDVDV